VRRAVVALAVATVLAACGGDSTAPPVPVSTVSIAPDDPAPLALGATLALTATAKDAGGTVLTGRTAAWTTSQSTVATVDPSTGLVRAVGAGVAVIRVTIDRKSDDVLVTVLAPVANVQATGRRASVGTSTALQLTATTRDQTALTRA